MLRAFDEQDDAAGGDGEGVGQRRAAADAPAFGSQKAGEDATGALIWREAEGAGQNEVDQGEDAAALGGEDEETADLERRHDECGSGEQLDVAAAEPAAAPAEDCGNEDCGSDEKAWDDPTVLEPQYEAEQDKAYRSDIRNCPQRYIMQRGAR